MVCTIGPATESEAVLARLIEAGMDVARLNFSHGTHDEHGERIARIRAISKAKNRPVAILQDLPGPKIRIGDIDDGPVTLKPGAEFVLTTDDVAGSEERVSVSHAQLPDEVKVGGRILLADGTIELLIRKIHGRNVECEIVIGGELSSRKGMSLPGSALSVDAFTDRDQAHLKYGLGQGVDYVAMSFVGCRDDVLQLRERVARHGHLVPVIAKIERHEALERIDEIIDTADGVMVARGDLAVETALERVPLVQKMIIKKCNRAGKPVITATQMLRSMVESPRPTRAEANDVANAVLDGTDAVMLSEETAIGSFPVEAVSTMARILEATESGGDLLTRDIKIDSGGATPIADAVARGAFSIARDLGAAAIITPTESGSTARKVAAFRPAMPIIAMSPYPEVVRQLNLIWGVHPVVSSAYTMADDMIDEATASARMTGLVAAGDLVVITAGMPVGVTGTTNLVKVVRLKQGG
jgi:pyruvate kinase